MALVSSEQAAVAARSRQVSGHLLALDGVRGLAILMVVCSHAFESNYESRAGIVSFLGNLFYYGLFGVDLFFVLSGFLITGILYDSLQDNGYFRKFYARRALRIFPLYYGVLIVCLLLTKPLHLHWGDMGWMLLLYLQNLHPQTILSFSPGAHIGLYHFWSLAIEEQFYLVWPAIIYFVRDRRKLLLMTLAGSAAALLLRVVILLYDGSGFAIHVSTLCRADALLVGGALAMLYRSSLWPRLTRLAPWGFLAFGGITAALIVLLEHIFVLSPLHMLYWLETVRYTLLALSFVWLVAWSLKRGSTCERIFQVSGLRFFGKYSYGIYVLHVIILGELLLPLRGAIAHFTDSKLLAVVGGGVICLALAVFAAWLSYNLYEKPFLRLKHFFNYKRDSLNHGAPDDAATTD
jgi:peptidoglycan/LPS O-acetylase OafA/YrhL